MSFAETSYADYNTFIHKSRYARWLEDAKRREHWPGTVSRVVDFWEGRFPWLTNEMPSELLGQTYAEAMYDYILNHKSMPSMRTMMTAGPALDRDEIAGYNCAAVAIEGTGPDLEIMTPEMEEAGFDEPIRIKMKEPKVFDELFYVLLCGTGMGFSIERQYIVNLPTVGKPLNRTIYRRTKKNYPGVDKEDLAWFDKRSNTIHVTDTKYGWASALRVLVVELYNGNFSIKWNLSRIRKKGAILKTFGGRASGPDPVDKLFKFAVDLFKGAEGRKLTSIECHSLVCMIADIVVVGGVRRSALISLSNLSDERMRHAKSGDWRTVNPHFALANNSTCYTEKPDIHAFTREWSSLIDSYSGERGFFNREASDKVAAKNGRRKPYDGFLCNPCSEIILRSMQVCNLSEVVARAGDSFETLRKKVFMATLLGTLQSTLTNFKYLNPEWARNTAEERLLGVSITGVFDHEVLSGQADKKLSVEGHWPRLFRNPEDNLATWLEELKQHAIDDNKKFALRMGIDQSAAITCVKPSGTVSQLVDSASGLHPRHAKFYMRTVRNDTKDPITSFLKDAGVPNEPAIGNSSTTVFSFPMKAPDGAVTRMDLTAIKHLELWKTYQEHWCEHKPSITVNVSDEEWMEVGAWVWKNFDILSGVSFLPRDDHNYAQAPYQDLTEAEYLEAKEAMPTGLDWEKLALFEAEDMTTGSQEYACQGGACEI